jgi:CHAT domain-containing protein
MEDNFRFLIESFKLIAANQPNTEQVYAFWQENIHKINGLPEIMPNIAMQILAVEGEDNTRQEFVCVLGIFGCFIQQFPSGSRSVNLELAITSYQICTKIFTRNEDPSEWAAYQYNLGTAYRDRIEGVHTANIELAIDAFHAALEIFYNYQDFPVEWSKTQQNLGNAYLQRIEGNRKQNIEQAIQFFQAFLEVHNRSDSLGLWSKFHSDLLVTYRDWIQGERKENLEQTIDAFRAALDIYNRQDFPVEWARTQYILGIAYCARIEGNRKENLELAIDAFRAALDIYSFSSSQIMSEILDFGAERRGLNSSPESLLLPKMNIDLAAYYSLKGFTCVGFPLERRMVQDDLEMACYDILEAECAENVEQAVELHLTALEVHSSQTFPVQQVTAQNDLDNSDPDRKVRFLQESLQLIANSQLNAELVYAFWQKNIDQIDESFIQIMPDLASQILEANGKEQRKFIGRIFGVFGNLIQKFSLGNQEINLELAITAYQICTNIFTRKEHTVDWALTQNCLGFVYKDRIAGEHKVNLELAIEFYRAALEVYSRQDFPIDWARTQNNLGRAYFDRIKGDRKANLELAIKFYCADLEVTTRQDFPVEWASTQLNLGRAYLKRIEGNRKENIEQAIHAWLASLKIHTRQDFSFDWAAIQHNLGCAYLERIEGNRKENLERAVQACLAALEIYTRQNFPVEWANAQSNLGNIYLTRIEGERKENIELAIHANRVSLEILTRQNFPFEWARNQSNLGTAYLKRIEGNCRGNIEQAIRACRSALEVYTPQAFPTHWADIQLQLGTAYLKRIEGNCRENIEQAIHACQSALEVYTPQAFPTQWAGLQNNLGSAYRNRIEGDRRENIEHAIHAHQNALKVHNRQDFPSEWAKNQMNLSSAYIERIEGEHKENIEDAIQVCLASLEVCTRQNDPIEWAGTQQNLGNAYWRRIEGDRKENIELAIRAYHASLEVYTREDFPVEWAMIQNNLSNVYRERIEGERKENRELAIQACLASLEVCTRENDPIGWATTQFSLGVAYRSRIGGDPTANIELAIQAYRSALEIFTRENFPIQWSQTQNNLSNVYRERIEGERKENIELAIQASLASLEVNTRQNNPIMWASNQHNLGLAYYERIKGNRKENLELAIYALRAALEVRQPELSPRDCLKTGSDLGNIAFQEGDWNIAIEGFEKAITAVEISRNWAKSDRDRQEIVNESIGIYEKMLQSCINSNRLDLALQTVERVRSKRLVDLMATPDLYPQGEIPEPVRLILEQIANIQQQMDDLRSGVQSSTSELGTRNRAATAPPTAEIQALEAQKQNFLDELSRYDAVSAQLVEINPPDVSQIQAELVDRPDVAILSFYTTTQDTHILIVRSDSIQCLTFPGQGSQLNSWLLNEWLLAYIVDKTSWQQNMPELLKQLAEKLELDRLVTEHLQDVSELILIPHLYLHLIPFAALPLNGNQQYLGDSATQTLGERFLLRYAPGCQVLKFCTDRAELPPPQQYGTVENATEDLPFAAIEGDAIAQIFQIKDTDRLRGSQQATIEQYKELLGRVNSVASCHHAQSRLDKPLESALLLANGRRVTLGDLLSPAWRFADLNDVFLSCCETGMTMTKTLTDELLTIGTGFLCAGARSVISALWSVDDIATALLSQIYHQYRSQGDDRVVSLQKAQQEVRGMSGEQVKALSEAEFIPASIAQQEQLEEHRKTARRQKQQATSGSETFQQWAAEENRYGKLIDRLVKSQMDLEKYWGEPSPFENPFYWASFTCQGLR